MVTISPKKLGKSIPYVDDIKLLVDLDSISDGLEKHLKYYSGKCKNLYLQPVNGETEVSKENHQLCLQLIERNPHVGLSVQLHKLIGVE